MLRETITLWPSSVQEGEAKFACFSLVRARAAEPSAFDTQRFSAPSRSETNVICDPSGE